MDDGRSVWDSAWFVMPIALVLAWILPFSFVVIVAWIWAVMTCDEVRYKATNGLRAAITLIGLALGTALCLWLAWHFACWMLCPLHPVLLVIYLLVTSVVGLVLGVLFLALCEA